MLNSSTCLHLCSSVSWLVYQFVFVDNWFTSSQHSQTNIDIGSESERKVATWKGIVASCLFLGSVDMELT